MEKINQQFKCPLCSSVLTESRYYEIVGVWEAKKKFEEELKNKIEIVKKEQIKLQNKLIKERENLKKKFELEKMREINKIKVIEKKLAQKELLKLKSKNREIIKKQKRELIESKKEAVNEGKLKEKKRADRLSEMLQKRMVDIEEKTKMIKELKEQLKKGTTPQLEGINLERELVKELKNKFPHDRVEHHGKGGDIHHYIICEGKEIALIVYECKKTQKFSKDYINQIKNDVIKNNANYGVLVTLASDKKQSQFWVENDILIVHPFGAPYIAEVLRKSLIQLYSLKLSDKELNERAKKLLEYIKSNKFRNSVKDNIHRSRELHELLNKEIEYHNTLWKKRDEHYNIIAKQSKDIEEESKAIVGEDLGENSIEGISQLEVKPRKSILVENR